jgi:hypothetical protein
LFLLAWCIHRRNWRSQDGVFGERGIEPGLDDNEETLRTLNWEKWKDKHRTQGGDADDVEVLPGLRSTEWDGSEVYGEMGERRRKNMSKLPSLLQPSTSFSPSLLDLPTVILHPSKHRSEAIVHWTDDEETLGRPHNIMHPPRGYEAHFPRGVRTRNTSDSSPTQKEFLLPQQHYRDHVAKSEESLGSSAAFAEDGHE